MTRVMIVDDHPIVRQGMQNILSNTEEICIVGEASDGIEAIEMAIRLRPDVILLDIQMPNVDGIQCLRRLKKEVPDLRIIILTHFDDEQFLLKAFQEGAHGFLLKNVSVDELIRAIQTVAQGKMLISPDMMDGVLRQFSDYTRVQVQKRYRLTKSDIEILRMIAQGATNNDISERLYWSSATTKRKISNIYRKLDASDRAEAVATAIRNGLI